MATSPDDTRLETAAAPPVRLKGRYRIERRLGAGGLGVVYSACDESLHDRRVVVKMPLVAAAQEPWLVERFAREVKALSAVDHPGIVGALDSGVTEDGRPFLVMQYVEGRSLDAIIPQTGLPFDHAGHILQQIGRALAAAHAKNICHRDLKPSNVMLQRTAEGGEYVRLIDFGLASMRDSLSRGETSTIVAGTLHYMAPEQLEGRVSTASDIYAFAVLAYELTTGRRPFLADSSVSLARMQSAGVSLRPSQLRPGLPAPAERLILQGLAHDARERPDGAAGYGDDLARALTGAQGAGDASGSAATIIAGADRRGLARAAAIVTLAIALIALSAWWTVEYVRGQQSAVPPPLGPPAVESRSAAPAVTPAGPPPGTEATPATAGRGGPPSQTSPAAGKDAPTERAKPAAYAGPKEGRLVWSGDLGPEQELDLGSKEAAAAVAGALPGVPVTIEVHPAGVQVVTPPSAANGWRRLVVRNGGRKQVIVIVKWTVLP